MGPVYVLVKEQGIIRRKKFNKSEGEVRVRHTWRRYSKLSYSTSSWIVAALVCMSVTLRH